MILSNSFKSLYSLRFPRVEAIRHVRHCVRAAGERSPNSHAPPLSPPCLHLHRYDKTAQDASTIEELDSVIKAAQRDKDYKVAQVCLCRVEAARRPGNLLLLGCAA